MMANGRMISKMGWAERLGTMVQTTRENTNKERNRDGVFTSGMMGVSMKATGKKTRSKAMALTNGLMEGASKENG